MGVFDKLQAILSKQAKGGKVDVNKRFELLKEAISGTMSNFYMARDKQSDEVIGLKIGIREKVEHFESRFVGLKKPAEGEIAIKFSHPNVVKTLEHGRTTENVPYMVMDYVKGLGMHIMINTNNHLLGENRLEMIEQSAMALKYVHDQGYIHRDICPRNFIVSPDGQHVKLIDFGLTLPATADFMQPGNRTGTPKYMSPEVVRRRPTDHRLDIFSFGVTAYHLYALQYPWPGEDMTGKAALAHDTVAPVDIAECCPKINKLLGRLIMKCLEVSPDARPQTMEEVVREIKRSRVTDK
ncbi:MAG TPA: serine/threonine protein kinase [Planctomycetaceae bacterium]|nr:serine/threonine protein kinase [Planctomycetaceae bacterium]